jgi:hypothetical protein
MFMYLIHFYVGVFKEFLNRLLKEALNPNYGLFQSSSDGFIYPSTNILTYEGNHHKAMELWMMLNDAYFFRISTWPLFLSWESHWEGFAGARIGRC